MSDEEIEGEGVEGEEDEEGGESEEEKEIVEEVKEPPKYPPYVPKINPLAQVANINRNLDILNSEINVISSEFMVMSSQMGNRPTYYNTSPSKNFGSSSYNNLGVTYTSPLLANIGPTTYWNNPNHINLSPSRPVQPALYNLSNNYVNTNPYKASVYTSPPRVNYSPVR